MMMGCGASGSSAIYAGPVWQGEGAAAGSTGAITLAWPTHQTDDIGFLFTVGASGTQTVASEGGWAHVTGSPVASGTSVCINLLWKRATSGSMPNITTNDMGDHQAGFIFTVRGCVTSGNPWDVIGTDNMGGISVSTINFANLTTTVNNALIVNLWGMSAVNNTPITAWGTPGITNPVSRFDGATAAGNDSSWGYLTGERITAGTIGAGTATPTNVGYAVSIAIALKGA